MTSVSQTSKMKILSHSILILRLNNLIFNERRFEQREPPTKNKVIQVDMGDQAQPKFISISESLLPIEKQDLISRIGIY